MGEPPQFPTRLAEACSHDAKGLRSAHDCAATDRVRVAFCDGDDEEVDIRRNLALLPSLNPPWSLQCVSLAEELCTALISSDSAISRKALCVPPAVVLRACAVSHAPRPTELLRSPQASSCTTTSPNNPLLLRDLCQLHTSDCTT